MALAAYPRRVRIGNFLRNLAPDATGRAHGPSERGDLAAAGDRLSGAAATSALTLTSESAVNRKSDRDNDHNDNQPMFNRQAAHASVPLQEIPTPRGWSALTRSGAKNVSESVMLTLRGFLRSRPQRGLLVSELSRSYRRSNALSASNGSLVRYSQMHISDRSLKRICQDEGCTHIR